jgi:hypothetical protein
MIGLKSSPRHGAPLRIRVEAPTWRLKSQIFVAIGQSQVQVEMQSCFGIFDGLVMVIPATCAGVVAAVNDTEGGPYGDSDEIVR